MTELVGLHVPKGLFLRDVTGKRIFLERPVEYENHIVTI